MNNKLISNQLSEQQNGMLVISAFVERFKSDTDYESCTAFLSIIKKDDIKKYSACAIYILKESKYKNDILKGIIQDVYNDPPCVVYNKEDYLALFDDLVKMSGDFSENSRLALLECMELIFAYGIQDIKTCIVRLIDKLPVSITTSDEYQMHVKLLCVYTYKYSSKNYNFIHSKLVEIYETCRRQKRKYMYGMIHYYFAVLEILSDIEDTYNYESRIDLACKYEYKLADILKKSY